MHSGPLEVRNLRKSFADTVAVDGVDLDLAPGEVLALVGPSGCGKSTLLRMIAGLVDADRGSIRLAGELVEDGKSRLPPERRSTGLVFQEHALFPHLTVEDNVGFGLRALDATAKAQRVSTMLAMIDLGDFGPRYPHELSGGERQRVALARALAPEPSIMLFDEPFAALDHNLRIQLRQSVLSVLRDTNTAAVFVTHDQREALAIGDRVAVMAGGRLLQVGAPSTVFHEPSNVFVGSFMGEASFIPIESEAGTDFTALGPVELDAATQDRSSVVAMVRPDDVEFTPALAGIAQILDAEYSGTGWLVTAEADAGYSVRFATSHLVEPSVGMRGDLRLSDGHRQAVVRT